MLITGAGGHAKVVIDVARAMGWDPVVALDPLGSGHFCSDVPVVGNDDKAAELYADGINHAVVAIGNNALRMKIGAQLLSIGFTCPAIVHPSAVISPFARVGEGTVVMAGAIVSSSAQVGRFVIANTGSIIEHDCIIGDGAHVAPRSVIGGNVKIGARTLFGIGSVARPGTTIGENATVGAGSVVVSHVEDSAVVMGAPAAPRRKPQS